MTRYNNKKSKTVKALNKGNKLAVSESEQKPGDATTIAADIATDIATDSSTRSDDARSLTLEVEDIKHSVPTDDEVSTTADHQATQASDVEMTQTDLPLESEPCQPLNITEFTPLSEAEVIERYPEHSEIIQERLLKGGIYHYLYVKMTSDQANRSKMLATAEYQKDFFVSKPSDDMLLLTRKDGALATFTVFGEIATSEEGNIHSAKGNHYTGRPGNPFKIVEDDSKCKNVFLLRRPTAAPEAISQLFTDQLDLLSSTFDALEAAYPGDWKPARGWLRATSGANGELDAIPVSTPPIYGRPPEPSRTPRRSRRRVTEKALAADVVIPDVSLGAFYDPKLLSDHRGDFFNLLQNKVVQHNTFYQIRMLELKVIAESDQEPELKLPPEVPHSVRASTMMVEMNTDFDDFRYHKKRRITAGGD
ncbi:hypothetical protein ONZ45_g16393 [Pleurotus djamor]|nr:hypothetical protein ONZ45_g16393 [Pleurotus djamor]